MKIGVSNLAWAPEAEAKALTLIAACGASGVEVAPAKIASWAELTPMRLAAFRNLCSDTGLAIPSLQGIFFGRPDVQLLQDAESFAAMCEHLHRVGVIAEMLGAGVVVFGAPHNRSCKGVSDVEALATERLRKLGDIAREHAIIVGIEPVPAQYGNDFAARASELLALLQTVRHPNVRFHMDCACVQLSGDSPVSAILDAAAADLLVHYHAAEPDLCSFTAPVCDHAACASALRQVKYDGWVVIEMRAHGLSAVDTALHLVRETYGGEVT